MEERLSQYWKALPLINNNDSGSVTVVKDVQLEKVNPSILVSLLGRIADTNVESLAKAWSPIIVIEFGITTEVSSVQFINVDPEMETTV